MCIKLLIRYPWDGCHLLDTPIYVYIDNNLQSLVMQLENPKYNDYKIYTMLYKYLPLLTSEDSF